MKTTMNISVDEKIKKDFTEFSKSIGTNPTNLLNMFMVESIKKQSVTFWRNVWIVEDKEWNETFSKISWEEKWSFILW